MKKILYSIKSALNQPFRCKQHAGEGGFTLNEMLVTISILAIAGAFAVPHVGNMRGTFNRMNAQSYLVQDLKQAQAESVTQGCRGVFVIDADNGGYKFGCDYLAYDTSETPTYDKVTLIRRLPAHIYIYSTSPIIFNSRGQAVDVDDIVANLTITLQDESSGSRSEFASGTLLGTGVFSLD